MNYGINVFVNSATEDSEVEVGQAVVRPSIFSLVPKWRRAFRWEWVTQQGSVWNCTGNRVLHFQYGDLSNVSLCVNIFDLNVAQQSGTSSSRASLVKAAAVFNFTIPGNQASNPLNGSNATLSQSTSPSFSVTDALTFNQGQQKTTGAVTVACDASASPVATSNNRCLWPYQSNSPSTPMNWMGAWQITIPMAGTVPDTARCLATVWIQLQVTVNGQTQSMYFYCDPEMDFDTTGG